MLRFAGDSDGGRQMASLLSVPSPIPTWHPPSAGPTLLHSKPLDMWIPSGVHLPDFTATVHHLPPTGTVHNLPRGLRPLLT
ncbi:hypothetical protein E2C01_047526 [Portunus trituberculatus]|uniref:Uncharacterized protein n=1 Tax=Portunus trituberculatus TaxID=210409 RepID=A0A5B7G949_PORTR|nr:hypothetical protein [Portunus trituberculatus]